jgi:O-antigen/teichoic acid export membrane protein
MLALLALGNLCNAFMYVPYTTQLAHGWTSFSVRVNIVAVLLIIPAIVWSVPRFGAVGAAAVWLALNASYVLVGIHFMHRKILPGEKWRWYWDAIFKPVIIGTAVMLASRQWVNLPQDRALLAAALVSIGLVELLLLLWVVPASRAFLLLQFRSMRGQAHNG